MLKGRALPGGQSGDLPSRMEMALPASLGSLLRCLSELANAGSMGCFEGVFYLLRDPDGLVRGPSSAPLATWFI